MEQPPFPMKVVEFHKNPEIINLVQAVFLAKRAISAKFQKYLNLNFVERVQEPA
jgi:hypothetical protein